jgi:hypothetical protein
MYRVTVNGVYNDWYDFQYALTDVLTRGFGQEFVFEQILVRDEDE